MMQQFIYGSADQITGRQVGGWGVLRSTPDLAPDTRRALQELTSVAMPVTLPKFPSADQLAGRAVRFRLDPDGAGYLACRSTEAGTDHTGRPGNVVSHCARIDAVQGVRPVDWFFSPGWVAPFGPREIAEARLPDGLPRPRGWEDTARWVRSDPDRTARIRWIVDVALTVLLDTQRLVLVAPSTEVAARWASVLSWILESELAALVRIRIGEDPSSAVAQLNTGPVLVTVAAPLDPASLRGLPQIDLTWQLDGDEAARSGKWLLPTGERIPASRSTALVVDLVFAEPGVALAVFEKRDELIARFTRAGHRLLVQHELLFLQAAWLITPGAQELARLDPIRQLLEAVGDDVRGWPEMVKLAAEIGRPTEEVDIYAMAEEPDLWQARRYQIEQALISAALLGRSGVDVEALLDGGRLDEAAGEQRDPALGDAVRDLAAVLHTTNREEG